MIEACGLSQQKCSACTPDTPRLTWPQIKRLLAVVPLWKYESDAGADALTRHFRFAKYADAIAFVNKVALMADAERHHPDIKIENFSQVILTMTTHAIRGLSENDFIMVAKIDLIQ